MNFTEHLPIARSAIFLALLTGCSGGEGDDSLNSGDGDLAAGDGGTTVSGDGDGDFATGGGSAGGSIGSGAAESGGAGGGGAETGGTGGAGTGGSCTDCLTPSGVNIILDTDLSFDCDDAGALSVLHSLADAGEANILGMMTSDIDINSPATADAINTQLGRPDIPIGMRAGANTDFGGSRYTGHVPDEFPHDLTNPPDAVTLYTQLLQAAEPNSVVIVTVGFLANVGQLLQAEPALVAEKVKLLVSMAGRFPSGSEFNIYQSATNDAIYALHNWPSPVVFSGYEIGLPISTGSADATPTSVKRSYETCGLGNPRPSWDQTAVLYAVRGAEGRWDLSAPGQISIAGNGSNTWTAGGGQQQYLISSASNQVIRSEISGLM